MSWPWRVGTKLGRTVYIGDQLVGMMDHAELAVLVVDAVNEAMQRRAGRLNDCSTCKHPSAQHGPASCTVNGCLCRCFTFRPDLRATPLPPSSVMNRVDRFERFMTLLANAVTTARTMEMRGAGTNVVNLLHSVIIDFYKEDPNA